MSLQTKPSKIRWIVLILAAATSWMLYLHRYTWNIVRPFLAEEYDFSNKQLEAIFTAFNFSYMVGQIPGGIVCDLFGARVFLSLLTAGWSLSLVLFATAGTFLTFFTYRVLFGAMQAGTYPGLSNVSRNWFPLENRTTMQGFVASFAGRMGGAVAPIIMATVLMHYMGYDWRTALIIMATLGLFLAAAVFVLLRNSPYQDARVNEAEKGLFKEDKLSEKPKKKVLDFWKATKHRSYQLVLSSQVFNTGADIVYTSIIGSYFFEQGINISELGYLVALPMFGGAFGGFFGGFLNDWVIRKTRSRKWGRRIVGFSGKAIAAVLVFITISQSHVYTVGVGLFVVKFFSDWSQPTVWGTCTDLGGPNSATVFSVVNTAGNVGGIVVSLFLVGPLLDKFAIIKIVNGVSEAVTNFTPVFVLVAILYTITALHWLKIDCTKPIDPDSFKN